MAEEQGMMTADNGGQGFDAGTAIGEGASGVDGSVQDRMMDGGTPDHLFDSGSGGYVDTTQGLPMYDENNQRIKSKEQLDAFLSRKGTAGQQAGKDKAPAQQQAQPGAQGGQAQPQAKAGEQPQFDAVSSLFAKDGALDRDAMLKSVNALQGGYNPEYLADYQARLDKVKADKAGAGAKLPPHEELAKFRQERFDKEIAPLNSLYQKIQAGDTAGAIAELQTAYNERNRALESEVLKKTIEIASGAARGPQTEQQAQAEADVLEGAASKSLDSVAHQIFGRTTEQSRAAVGEMLFGNAATKAKGEMSEILQLTYDLVNEAAKNPDIVLGGDFKSWFMKNIASKQARFATIARTGYRAYNGANLKYYIDGARQSVAKQQQRVAGTQQRNPNASARSSAPGAKNGMAGYFAVEV
jgi:hypothetical protein